MNRKARRKEEACDPKIKEYLDCLKLMKAATNGRDSHTIWKACVMIMANVMNHAGGDEAGIDVFATDIKNMFKLIQLEHTGELQ